MPPGRGYAHLRVALGSLPKHREHLWSAHALQGADLEASAPWQRQLGTTLGDSEKIQSNSRNRTSSHGPQGCVYNRGVQAPGEGHGWSPACPGQSLAELPQCTLQMRGLLQQWDSRRRLW